MSKQNCKTVVINTLGNSDKEELSMSSLAPTFGKDIENIAMIDADAYHLACQLKGDQIFVISIRDLKF